MGTVAHIFTCSSWISSSARSGVNRPSTMTSRTPPMSPTTIVEWQPDTWKRGEVNRATIWLLPAPGATPSDEMPSSARTALSAIDRNTVFCRLATMDRWVLMAPLERPVVPDV